MIEYHSKFIFWDLLRVEFAFALHSIWYSHSTAFRFVYDISVDIYLFVQLLVPVSETSHRRVGLDWRFALEFPGEWITASDTLTVSWNCICFCCVRHIFEIGLIWGLTNNKLVICLIRITFWTDIYVLYISPLILMLLCCLWFHTMY